MQQKIAKIKVVVKQRWLLRRQNIKISSLFTKLFSIVGKSVVIVIVILPVESFGVKWNGSGAKPTNEEKKKLVVAFT